MKETEIPEIPEILTENFNLNLKTCKKLNPLFPEEEEFIDFGRFCYKHNITEEANENTMKVYEFFSKPEHLHAYAKVYDVNEALKSYEKFPEDTVNVIDSLEDHTIAWESLINSFDFTPIEILTFIKEGDTTVILEGDQRPDAPPGVISAQNIVIFDELAEFQPVIQDNVRLSWKLRSAFFFGQKRLINTVAPKCFWEYLDSIIDIEKIIK